jgi:ribosome-binding protein aMBF1 (putative translation factor)
MNSKNKLQESADFQDYLTEKLKKPSFKKNYNEYGKQLEIAYQVLTLRKQQKLSQSELAKKIGTRQSNVARMESGQQNFTADMLQKIATAFNRRIKIEFVR